MYLKTVGATPAIDRAQAARLRDSDEFKKALAEGKQVNALVDVKQATPDDAPANDAETKIYTAPATAPEAPQQAVVVTVYSTVYNGYQLTIRRTIWITLKPATKGKGDAAPKDASPSDPGAEHRPLQFDDYRDLSGFAFDEEMRRHLLERLAISARGDNRAEPTDSSVIMENTQNDEGTAMSQWQDYWVTLDKPAEETLSLDVQISQSGTGASAPVGTTERAWADADLAALATQNGGAAEGYLIHDANGNVVSGDTITLTIEKGSAVTDPFYVETWEDGTSPDALALSIVGTEPTDLATLQNS